MNILKRVFGRPSETLEAVYNIERYNVRRAPSGSIMGRRERP
jgi:hypothetical protein